MAGNKQNSDELYLQVFHIELKDPETGEPVVRDFVGQALFTPDQIDRFGDIEIEDLITDMGFGQPTLYNDAITEKIRKLSRQNDNNKPD